MQIVKLETLDYSPDKHRVIRIVRAIVIWILIIVIQMTQKRTRTKLENATTIVKHNRKPQIGISRQQTLCEVGCSNIILNNEEPERRLRRGARFKLEIPLSKII